MPELKEKVEISAARAAAGKAAGRIKAEKRNSERRPGIVFFMGIPYLAPPRTHRA